MTKLLVTWFDGGTEDPKPVKLRRRWFPWPSDNVTFGRTIFLKHQAVTGPTLRHELTHVAQYDRLGWREFLWRYLTGGRRHLEAEAERAQRNEYPTWRFLRDPALPTPFTVA